MQHKVKLTVLDKKVYPELQREYCADPESGTCPVYNIGDEFVFERYGGEDTFWRMGIGSLVRTDGDPDEVAGGPSLPHCSELWDAVSRYIYTGLQGGSIMRNWMDDERVMIACCSDGTRPVIFRIQRMDYLAVHAEGPYDRDAAAQALMEVDGVTDVAFRDGFAEVYVEGAVDIDEVVDAMSSAGARVTSVE